MVAGDVGDGGAVTGVTKDVPDNPVVLRVPIPAFAQPPAIDDVADQEQEVSGHRPEEVRQKIRSRALGAEMRVGNENRPVVMSTRPVVVRSWIECIHAPVLSSSCWTTLVSVTG